MGMNEWDGNERELWKWIPERVERARAAARLRNLRREFEALLSPTVAWIDRVVGGGR